MSPNHMMEGRHTELSAKNRFSILGPTGWLQGRSKISKFSHILTYFDIPYDDSVGPKIVILFFSLSSVCLVSLM